MKISPKQQKILMDRLSDPYLIAECLKDGEWRHLSEDDIIPAVLEVAESVEKGFLPPCNDRLHLDIVEDAYGGFPIDEAADVYLCGDLSFGEWQGYRRAYEALGKKISKLKEGGK